MNRTRFSHLSPKRQRGTPRPHALWSVSRWSVSRTLPVSGTPRARSRAGFSLIELMMVIVVIGILAGLVLTAGRGALYRGRITQVTTEIKNLEQAIAEFKREYGVEPPSFVVLYESGTNASSAPNWSAAQGGGNQAAAISRARIRGIWPQFDFTDVGDPSGNTVQTANSGATPGDAVRDLDEDGNDGEVIYLNGAECLVFFLGGVFNKADVNGDGTLDWVPQGFSPNPSDPFALGGSRKGPFYEFDPGRFVDKDSDGFPEFVDPLPSQQTPYQYFSSYDGTGYTPRGIDGQYGPPLSSNGEELDNESIPNGLASHYILSDANTSGSGYPTPPDPKAVHKPQGFQIISPGYDGEFGVGGAWVSGKPLSPTPDPTGQRANNLQFERDNITNFANGTLE